MESNDNNNHGEEQQQKGARKRKFYELVNGNDDQEVDQQQEPAGNCSSRKNREEEAYYDLDLEEVCICIMHSIYLKGQKNNVRGKKHLSPLHLEIWIKYGQRVLSALHTQAMNFLKKT
jgi:hypothetical protein